MRLLKSGVSVEYVDANRQIIMKDNDIVATRLGDHNLSELLAKQWTKWPLGMPPSPFYKPSSVSLVWWEVPLEFIVLG
jgi:hypothetical protein